MRTLALIALLLLLPFVQASMLTVQVVVDQDTPSIGATVSLITGGVALSTQRADQSGSVTFNVSDGTYFIDVNKSVIYPEYVVLKVVSGDSSMRIVRRQLINYANVYGQATGPSNFANSSVAAYQNGQIVQRTALNKDGFYMLQFLPEGTYELRFDSPGFETNSVQVFLPTSQFTPVSVAAALARVSNSASIFLRCEMFLCVGNFLFEQIAQGGQQLFHPPIHIHRLRPATQRFGHVRRLESGLFHPK